LPEPDDLLPERREELAIRVLDELFLYDVEDIFPDEERP
jgi:hypothetical protein